MNIHEDPARLQVGGTLNPHKHIYIERPDDARLLKLLKAKVYCNILSSRQMGKSSLMARTAIELNAANIRTVTIDVAGVLGRTDVETWYQGLLGSIADDLGLGIKIRSWWHSVSGSKNQKLLRFFKKELPASGTSPIVVFLDEIDSTLDRPYTDDLFTAIRTMHNDRAFVNAYEGITFCLIGVATPNELIKDKRTTPYNIGQTLTLEDFDEERDDLSPLHRYLSDDPWHAKAVLGKILYWTGGHPYLTLEFCQRLHDSKGGDLDIDTYVQTSFTHFDRLRGDSHFHDIDRFLRERATNPLFDVFKPYQRILDGKRERDKTTFLHAYLKLSGLVKRDDNGFLVVRNRLYERLFTSDWIRAASPRKRWHRGQRIALASSILLLVILVSLGLLNHNIQHDIDPTELDFQFARELIPKSPIVNEVKVGRIHRYFIKLEVGEFLEVVVDPRGTDVAMGLLDHENRPQVRINAVGVGKPERILWLAPGKGVHIIEVTAANDGSYSIEVLERRKATPQDRVRAMAFKHAADGDRFIAAGELDPAADQYRKALASWQELGDLSGEAYALYRLGNIYGSYPAKHREAIEFYSRALELFISNERDLTHEAATLHNMGRIFSQQGRVGEAIDYYEQALAIEEQLTSSRGDAMILNDLAFNYDLRGESQKALSLCERALDRSRETGNARDEAATLQNRGRILLGLGAESDALTDFLLAHAIRKRLGDERGLASILGSLSEVYELQGHLVEALAAAQRGVEIWSRLGDKLGLASSLSVVGSIQDKMGATDAASASYLRALQISREEGSRLNEVMTMLALGWHHLPKSPERARELFREALVVFEEIGDRNSEASCLLGIAKAERQQGRLLEAQQHIESALDVIENLRMEPARYDLRTSFLATKQDFFDFYIEVLMELHQGNPAAGYDARALMASERSRARSLLDHLHESRVEIRSGVGRAQLDRQRELVRKINSKELERIQVRGLSGAADKMAAIDRELRSLLREAEEIRAEIRLASPTYAAHSSPTPLGIGEIQRRLLDEDTLLLEFDLGSACSYLWVVSNTSLHSFELPPKSVIENLAREAYDLLKVSNQRRYGRFAEVSLERLSDILLGAIEPLLRKKRLLVVTEGALQFIPFGSLPIPGGFNSTSERPPKYLISEHEIVSIPSATTLAVLRRMLGGRAPAPRTLAVVADPVFSLNDNRSPSRNESSPEPSLGSFLHLQRLVYSGEEARAILSLVSPENGFGALGFDASRETVFSGRLADYRIVHFATVGVLNAEHPELSGIVLSMVDENGRPQDGFVRAHDIYNLELKADLIVLSAGDTALGKEIHGEGLVGLTRAFMYSGAPRVVASLWSLNDLATSELMVRFYRHLLQDGLSPAAALRQAQISIAQEPQWQAPYYWAGFIFQGEWR